MSNCEETFQRLVGKLKSVPHCHGMVVRLLDTRNRPGRESPMRRLVEEPGYFVAVSFKPSVGDAGRVVQPSDYDVLYTDAGTLLAIIASMSKKLGQVTQLDVKTTMASHLLHFSAAPRERRNPVHDSVHYSGSSSVVSIYCNYSSIDDVERVLEVNGESLLEATVKFVDAVEAASRMLGKVRESPDETVSAE